MAAIAALAGGPVLGADAVPFTRGSGDAIVVPVTIAGHGPFPFLLDTGATFTRVDSLLAGELALEPGDPMDVVTVTGRRTLARTRVPRLGLGPHVLDDVDAIAGGDLPLPAKGLTIRGVLGQSALARISYGIDYRRGRIVFEEPSRGRPARVPLEWHEGRPAALVHDHDARPLRLVLDAGLNEPILFERPGRPLPFRSVPGLRYRAVTVGGDASLRGVTVPSLDVGSIRLERLRAAVVADAQAGVRREDGLLPTRLFASVFFDRDAGEVVLEPR